MACAEPKAAWQYYRGGRPQFVAPPPGSVADGLFRPIEVPCGRCMGCLIRTARDWAIRCRLEAQEHEASCWATLTYDDEHLPATLWKPHLSGYLKRLRARVHPRPVKFFGVGEYGDLNGRPHYHVILYGLPETERHITSAWRLGHADADYLTPARIAYAAGYAQKKLNAASAIGPATVEAVDPETGEVINIRWQPPFRLMSRGGKNGSGIGAAARRHARSWRSTAIHNGAAVPVPRYLHAAWLNQASDVDVAKLIAEREALPRRSLQQREAGEKIALAKFGLSTQRRQLR